MLGIIRDKVMAGGNPGQPSYASDLGRGNPQVVPLIGGRFARACSPSGIRMDLVLDEIAPRDAWDY